MSFISMKKAVIRTVNRGALQIKKYSPEILTVTAVVSGIAAVGTAIERTMKLDDVLGEIEHNNEKLEQMKDYKENGVVTEEQYSDEELMQARVVYSAQAVLKLANHYRLPITLLGLSVVSQLGSYSILKKRYAGAVAAYMATQAAFEAYRHEIREEVGEEQEKDIFETVKQKIGDHEKRLDDAIKKGDSKQKQSYQVSQYARWFDEASRYWKKYPGANAMFVRSQEKYFNDILRIHGHVFLNEVYDALDIPRTPAGAVVGWIFNPDAKGPQIDFGLLDGSIERYRDFVNGREPNVLLDFNVDGVIYDLI